MAGNRELTPIHITTKREAIPAPRRAEKSLLQEPAPAPQCRIGVTLLGSRLYPFAARICACSAPASCVHCSGVSG